MKLITNPTTEHNIIDYNVGGKLYTLKAGTSERMPDEVVDYLCRVYPFLVDDGVCLEPTAPIEEKVNAKVESRKAVDEAKLDPSEDLSMIHGLGAKSVDKLLKAGIKTKSAFNKLTQEELKDIVGSLVASKFKSA